MPGLVNPWPSCSGLAAQQSKQLCNEQADFSKVVQRCPKRTHRHLERQLETGHFENCRSHASPRGLSELGQNSVQTSGCSQRTRSHAKRLLSDSRKAKIRTTTYNTGWRALLS